MTEDDYLTLARAMLRRGLHRSGLTHKFITYHQLVKELKDILENYQAEIA